MERSDEQDDDEYEGVQKILGGGQTGADRGGWDAARDLRLKYGGWVPNGRRAEDGTIPGMYFEGPYLNGIWETLDTDYRARTELNVAASNGTVVFTRGPLTPGSKITVVYAGRLGRPLLHVDLSKHSLDAAGKLVAEFVRKNETRILNVAGSRESSAPGLQRDVKAVILNAFF